VLHDIHKRALRRAAEIVGGNEELMRYLSVSEAEFSGWAGERDLPREIFLRLVDIITDEGVQIVQGTRG
jgi:DNA-binding transcriptional regulator YiaG